MDQDWRLTMSSPDPDPVEADPLAIAASRGIDLTRVRTYRDLRAVVQARAQEDLDQLHVALWAQGRLYPETDECRPAEVLREAAGAFLGPHRELSDVVVVRSAPQDELRTDGHLAARVLQSLVVRCLDGGSWEGGAVLSYERQAGCPVFRVRPKAMEGRHTLPVLAGGMAFRDLRLMAERGLGARVEADLGEGSFTLVLPESALAATARREALPPAAAPEAQAEARGTVLVVDDSRSIRRLLESILSAEHRVLVAESGPEAIHLAIDQQPDLVLLDVVMQGMDGYAVCARLKSDPRTEEIPVLFLTSLKGEAEETLALEAGAIDFISKPITPTAVAARVRNHMALKRSQDQIRAISLLDGLTGIPNRRSFDRHLKEAWARARLGGTPLSLILGDVDHFKLYNDHYGHAQGDACLREVARHFAGAMMRTGDLAARYGGEEFVALLPGTDLAGAEVVAERILDRVTAAAMPHARSSVRDSVSVSLGLACIVPEGALESAFLVEQADRALYRAKAEGRNRAVVSAGGSGT